MHMSKSTDMQVAALLRTLEQRRLSAGASQAQWGRRVGISQGHYSKIIKLLAPPGRNLLARIRAFIEEPTQSEFEVNLLAAARTAPRFGELLRALLDMHYDASSKTT